MELIEDEKHVRKIEEVIVDLSEKDKAIPAK